MIEIVKSMNFTAVEQALVSLNVARNSHAYKLIDKLLSRLIALGKRWEYCRVWSIIRHLNSRYSIRRMDIYREFVKNLARYAEQNYRKFYLEEQR